MDNILSIEKLAELFSFVATKEDKRTKISPFVFLIYLVFDLSKDNDQRSLAGMCRTLAESTGIRISRSSFWERLSRNRLKKHYSH